MQKIKTSKKQLDFNLIYQKLVNQIIFGSFKY